MDESPAPPRFLLQVRRNSVALISLCLAIASLGYNTWRNERTEYQRNIRNAAFQVIQDLSTLQETVFTLAWIRNEDRDPTLEFSGWGKALAIRDISRLLPPPGPAEGMAVYESYRDEFDSLAVRSGSGPDDRANAARARDRVSAEIGDARVALIDIIETLD